MFFQIFAACALFLTLVSTASATFPSYFPLAGEPVIRIGLSTNSSSVNIATTDPQLVAFSDNDPQRFLATNRVSVTARAYRPPEVENFRIEFQNLPSQNDATNLANDIRTATGQTVLASIDSVSNTWKIWVGRMMATSEEASELKAKLTDKGFEDAVIVSEKKLLPSQDALALSQQLKMSGKSEVRSLIRSTGSTVLATEVNPNLREVIISGGAEPARFSSLKPVSFGSMNERVVPVRVNGKAYRGKVEVFVNSRGSLTVVNVVSLEDYLLGVVPSELSLPQLEAQKAQAVAARTYAVANLSNYGNKGFDLLPTVHSQVYGGVGAESRMGTQAVLETRGIIASYAGKPINAYYTSTCGGRTENSENVFDKAEPYLRGVECSLEARRQIEPFLIKTLRQPAKLRSDANLELVRWMSLLAVNGFQLSVPQLTDEWFEDEPNQSEISNWLNQLAVKFGRPFPNATKDSARPLELARLLVSFIYPPDYPDTLLSDSDVAYHLAFDDAGEIPKARRADIAVLLRDGYFTINPDLTLKPSKTFSRAQMLRIIRQVYEKKKWMPVLQSGTSRPTADGRLVLKSGKAERQVTVRPDVFLFREFGSDLYTVREAALVGGEEVRFQTDASGAVSYLEIRPGEVVTSAENASPFTHWSTTLSSSAVQSRLSRYVRGIGTLFDVNVKKRGYSRRAVELEIIGSNGVKILKGGKIRSALRLREQLFVINKRYAGNQVASYTFTGRGWGHGVGMCQYGAYGFAKMGLKYDQIIRHYYTGVDLTKAY